MALSLILAETLGASSVSQRFQRDDQGGRALDEWHRPCHAMVRSMYRENNDTSCCSSCKPVLPQKATNLKAGLLRA
jgi:hypothetical protein